MAKTVAVVGASNDRRKFGNKALRAYRAQGHTVIPINPHESEVEGVRAYTSVLDVPGPIDLATVYVQPEVAIIWDGAWSRYGHPSHVVLDRLKAANAKVYRTDLQGEITITTKGKGDPGKLYDIKAAKETKEDIWAGREGTKDDSSRSGFIAYGDFGPPPKPKTEKPKK